MIDVAGLARGIAVAAGIPDELLGAVVHRAKSAVRAVEIVAGRYYGAPTVPPRTAVESAVTREIEDHARGCLERRCAPLKGTR